MSDEDAVNKVYAHNQDKNSRKNRKRKNLGSDFEDSVKNVKKNSKQMVEQNNNFSSDSSEEETLEPVPTVKKNPKSISSPGDTFGQSYMKINYF